MLPVRIAYAALGSGSAPVWAAQEAGIFGDEGLDAEVVLIRGSGNVTRALLANEVQFANIAAPLVVDANLRGGDLVFLTGGLNWLIQSLVVRPEILDVEQLRRRTLGVAAHAGGVDDYIIPYLLERHGLDPKADLQSRPVDSQPDAIEKLIAREIDAALFSPPYVFEAVKRGLRVLIDGGALRIDYQLGGIVASRAFVDKHGDLTRRVVRAYVGGVHWYKTNPDLMLAVFRRYSRIEDEAVARQTYAAVDPYFQPAPYPSVPGIQTILDQAAVRDPAARALQATALIDDRWVAELEHSGVIAALYAGGANAR